MDTGQRIKELRKRLGWTQEELGERAGYKKNSITQMERGTWKPTQHVIVKLAAALHTTPGYLLGWEDEQDTISAVESIMKLLPDEQNAKLLDFAKFLYAESNKKE